jgi:hypothetical protein
MQKGRACVEAPRQLEDLEWSLPPWTDTPLPRTSDKCREKKETLATQSKPPWRSVNDRYHQNQVGRK